MAQNFDVFFWSPPPLIARLHNNQDISKRTRGPAFFYKHFSKKVKLLHVKRLPTLIRDFTTIVGKTIANGVQSLPSNPYSIRDFFRVLDDIETRVVDEKEVACFYERTTATFCLGLASSLSLGVPKLLRWNQSGYVSGYAIADGFLYFPEPTALPDLYAQLEVGMGKETVKQIRPMAEKRSSLATYEFKNLAAGREEVMLAVPNLSNLPIFEWTNCTAPDCATLTKHEEQRTKYFRIASCLYGRLHEPTEVEGGVKRGWYIKEFVGEPWEKGGLYWLMTTLQEIIPQIFIPHVPALIPPPSRPSTAPYAPLTAPPRHHVPYWIAHSPHLADWMMQRLRTYLITAPGSNMPPSVELQARINDLPLATPAGELSSEETTAQFWDYNLFPLIRRAVQDVDQLPPGILPAMQVRRTLYSQNPDALVRPTPDTPPRLHLEHKNWMVFNTFATQILALAQRVENGQLGTSLELGIREEGARSIIMKMGVSMIGRQDLMPYGILFGGHRFIIFSLFGNGDTLGEVRYGLACSDIIDCTNIARPLIPLIIYILLGNIDDLQSFQPAFTIPPVPTPVILDSKPVTRSKKRTFMSTFSKKFNVKAIFNHTSNDAVSRSFVLYREPFFQAVEDSFASNASLVPFAEIQISLTECIGHGASGQVFIGTADNEKFAIKIAPWKIGKDMLRHEADVYKILSDLQGRCIPKIYGFFGSEHLKALIMDYMGHSIENISDLSMDQRRQLLEELCLIHEHGVLHGDLRAPNIVLLNGSAHFIDFSHAHEHQCTGRATCFELIDAHQFLLLDLDYPQIGQ